MNGSQDDHTTSAWSAFVMRSPTGACLAFALGSTALIEGAAMAVLGEGSVPGWLLPVAGLFSFAVASMTALATIGRAARVGFHRVHDPKPDEWRVGGRLPFAAEGSAEMSRRRGRSRAQGSRARRSRDRAGDAATKAPRPNRGVSGPIRSWPNPLSED